MLSSPFTDAAAAMPLRCLVVDDDPAAVQVILQCLSRIPSLQAVGSCNNAVDALELLRQQPVDVLFLDILMPLVSGIDLLRLMLHQLPRLPYTILITGSTTHAVEAFEYAVVDYLLKPISFARFEQAIDKVELLVAKELLTNRRAALVTSSLFFIKGMGHKRTRVNLEEVYYFEASSSYVNIITEHKQLTISSSLRELQKRLPANQFVPIHRSFLVNVYLIESVETDVLRIKNKQLPISLPHRASLLERLHML